MLLKFIPEALLSFFFSKAGMVVLIIVLSGIGLGYCSYKTKEHRQKKEVVKQTEVVKKKALDKAEVSKDLKKKDDLLRQKELKIIRDKAAKTPAEQAALDSEDALLREIEQSKKETMTDEKRAYLKEKARLLKVVE